MQMGYNKKLATLIDHELNGIKYVLTRRGVIGTSAYDLAVAAKSDPSLDSLDFSDLLRPVRAGSHRDEVCRRLGAGVDGNRVPHVTHN